jgi:hypothetical protein
MIELRWVNDGKVKTLEYRTVTSSTNYSNIDENSDFATVKKYSEWKPVPEVNIASKTVPTFE